VAGVCGYYAAASVPSLRERLVGESGYPQNFAGWTVLADAVAERRATMPPGTRILADNFKVGAELGFALGQPNIRVLPHPLNHKHGRSPQLRLWNLTARRREALGRHPLLLVVGASEVELKSLPWQYHALCRRVGPLPAPQVVNVDHGAQRFLLFALGRARAPGPCTTPAIAWIDQPLAGERVEDRFDVSGWAFKDGVGLSGVEITLDGQPVARSRYGLVNQRPESAWPMSNDPQHPRVGFSAQVDVSGVAVGRHWLGLRLHGRDGSVEDWSEQPLDIVR
jgi:hypothetical protein